MQDKDLSDIFLTLVRVGIGHDTITLKQDANWQSIIALADKQGLSAIVLNGLNGLPGSYRPSKNLLLHWIGEVLQGYEQRFAQYEKAIAELATFYNRHGFKMMILKGYACALDWPKPEHRPCGDIDIWLFGQQQEADKELISSLKIQDPSFEIDNSHHHHSVFKWGEFTVENHYDFINTKVLKSSKELEAILKELGGDDSNVVEICGAKIYIPSPNLHALFLLRHMVSHFASSNITLRHVLDWAFFVKAHGKDVDWNWLEDLFEKYHIKDFYNCLNGICVDDLGFTADIFHSVRYDSVMKEKILKDILAPRFTSEEPAGFISRLLYKYRRWQGNAWKKNLCYSESRAYMFFSGLRMHLIKPMYKV